jgi:signal peptidase I
MKRAIGLLLLFIACIAGFLTVKGVFPFIPNFGNSMELTLQPGSLLTIKPVKPENIKVGDIIIYNVPVTVREYYNYPAVVSHRVIGIKTDPSLGFRTKGDNTGEDPFTIRPIDVLGTVGIQIPYLGLPLIFFQSRQGLIFVSIALVLLAVLLYGREGSAMIFRRIFAPVTNEEKPTSRALTPRIEAIEKKIDITEKAQPQPKKAAKESVKPFFTALNKSVPPKDGQKHEELPKEALSAEKALFEALDRLNNMLKKSKDQV